MPVRFSQHEVGTLLQQLVDAQDGTLGDSVEAWSACLCGDTEGVKGLTGMCLDEVSQTHSPACVCKMV